MAKKLVVAAMGGSRAPIPCELIEMPEGVLFTNAGRKPSPYATQLEMLVAAPLKVLRYSGLRAKAQVRKYARLKGVKVELAEQGGVLFVRLAPPRKGLEDVRRGGVMKALHAEGGTATLAGIARQSGLTAGVLVPLLAEMVADGAIEGDGKCYRLRPEPKVRRAG